MDYLRPRILQDFFGSIDPSSYVKVDGTVVEKIMSLESPDVNGMMKDRLRVYFPENCKVTFIGAGTLEPALNDVTWTVKEVEIPSFEYIIFNEEGIEERKAVYNEPVYCDIGGYATEEKEEIRNLDIVVLADSEDPDTWDFEVEDTRPY
ncbi:MAG: hypothetical protein CMI60_06755 [Parvibaculum sp.]|nr:hypothetical protein [Parvibaculum sp.]